MVTPDVGSLLFPPDVISPALRYGVRGAKRSPGMLGYSGTTHATLPKEILSVNLESSGIT